MPLKQQRLKMREMEACESCLHLAIAHNNSQSISIVLTTFENKSRQLIKKLNDQLWLFQAIAFEAAVQREIKTSKVIAVQPS